MSFLFLYFTASVILFSSYSESYTLQKCTSFSSKLYAYSEDGKIATNSALGNSVSIFESVESVQDALCNDFIISAQNAISRHDRFYVRIHVYLYENIKRSISPEELLSNTFI
jgi:hypothetical protein